MILRISYTNCGRQNLTTTDMGFDATDRRWMALALGLGRRGWGLTWPNPAVGCVIVSNTGAVIGRGWTQPGGRPHAETMALAQAGAGARGATAYVTLEPCAHHGQTPPCADALVRAGLRRVVSAITDPDPRVAGKGLGILRRANITVETGCLQEQAAQDHAGFFLRTGESRPFVTLKLATSFDGRIATETGESRWITGPQARHYVHYLRATHDGVMVGSGTSIADDPALNVRGFGARRQPVRIVCDTALGTPPEGILGRSATALEPVWMCHGPDARPGGWQQTGAILLVCRIGAGGHLDLLDVLKTLADRGLTRLFCEGGGRLAASLLSLGLVDRLVGMTAGLALGARGKPAIGPLPVAPLAGFPRFRLRQTRPLGQDILHIWDKSA